MSPIIVLARMRASNDRAEELERALRQLTAQTRAEPGCLQYDLHVGVDDPSVFAFVEAWESRDAIDQHNASAHIAAFLARAPELLDGPIQVDVLQRVS